MTGFGRVKTTFGDRNISIELRSLNSKYTDVRLKVPNHYREKELELRSMITKRAERGKIDFSLDIQGPENDGEISLNQHLFRKYHRELSSLSSDLDMPSGDLMQAILRLPNVVATQEEALEEGEWKAVTRALDEALDQFLDYRREEGRALEKDIRLRIDNILQYLGELKPFEEERVERLRQRLHQNLDEHLGKEKVDENRFEQEIIYYLEKLDITEEKVRLEQHCHYFLEVLDKTNSQKGRKLSFISQEIGREINTMGAKAYSSDIQRLVVNMKDELEKIKEQVANTV
jgi:uncharacterized protein (TIGR00255 family)